jgi:osmoprotectant transport system permease protein
MTFVVAQTDRPLIDWSWLARNLDDIWDRTLEHLYLTVLAVGMGLVISLALTAVALRWPKAYNPIASMGGLLYTIPSLALFAFVVPFTGFSVTTAEIALVSYTILILVRNIHTGITGVSPWVVEAADGMGYRPVRRFVQIQLPLAAPVIVAGIRVATVTVVGLVTVTALIGQGGLGFFILDGIRRSILFPTEIIVGTILSAVLAAVLDVGLLGVERAITPWKRGRR